MPGTSQEYESECGFNLGWKRLEFLSPGFSQTHTQGQDLFVGLYQSNSGEFLGSRVDSPLQVMMKNLETNAKNVEEEL